MMAARKSPLRSVADDEKPPKKGPLTVSQAVESGTQREQLAALRARISRAIDDPNIRGADLAALSRRLLEIGREVDALDAAEKQEAVESVIVPNEAFDAEAL